MIKLVTIILINFIALGSFAQIKLEIEKPVPVEYVPESAKAYVCNLFPEAKVKWILERSNSGDNVEAKVKKAGKKYSIEFSQEGVFEDVEVEVEEEELAKPSLNAITNQLKTDFDRYKIVKIQHHYSGDKKEIKHLLNGNEVNLKYVRQLYEIVIYGIKDKVINSFEYTFSINGEFVERLKNAESNSDNLLF